TSDPSRERTPWEYSRRASPTFRVQIESEPSWAAMSSAMNSNLVNAGSGDCPRDAERAKTPDEGYKQAFVDGLVNGSNRLQARIPVRSGRVASSAGGRAHRDHLDQARASGRMPISPPIRWVALRPAPVSTSTVV